MFSNILLGAAGFPVADLGDEISQSLRFPTNAGSERLEWATGPSTTTSWAVSFWMKLGQVGQATDGTIWQASGASSGPGLYINHNPAAGTDMGVLRDPNNGYSSGRSLRDPSAWYHIVHTFHASGGTNRVRIYINGETALDTTGVGATIDPGKFRIGGNAQWPQPQFQGYMAEWHFVSNNGNLTAADFGRTNEDGVWVPKNYTGTYGSNGFHLDFADSSDLGNDVSGNNNDFTATGFDTGNVALYSANLVSSSGTWASGRTPTHLFGDTSTSTMAQVGATGATMTFTPTTPINYQSLHYFNHGATWNLNSGTTGGTAGAAGWQEIDGNPGTLTSLQFLNSGGGASAVGAIAINGTAAANILVDNTDNDVNLLDTPTSNYATLNPLVASSSATFSRSNLTYAASTTLSDYAVGTMAMKDKCYWETEIIAGTNIGVGIGEITDTSADSYLGGTGGDTHGYGFNGQILTGAVASSTQATYTTGDIIGQAYDPETGKWWVAKNGTWQNSGDPAAGSGQVATVASASRTIMTPGINPYSSTHRINFGQIPFIYTAPTGFKALQTNNFSEPTIKNGSDHFQAITDTGANILTAAQAAFSNGLWWIKDRANSNQHQLVDSVRGSNLAFTNPAKGPESTYAAPTGDCVAWCWGTDNTGTNADAGFQILTWDGTGSARTISHDLDQSRPLDMILVKMHSAAAGNTYVNNANIPFWCSGLADNGYGYFNLNLAFGTTTSFFNGNPNASLGNLTLGGDPDVNGNPVTYGATANYVGYVWQSIPGYSAFGSYTGNNSDDGPFIYTGMRSAFVMIKRTDANGNWYVWDSTRDINNPCYHHLIPDATNPENTNSGHGNQIDILSNGFKLRRNGGNTNAAGTYIYAAFAENPFGGENAPPATAR